jgi:hypothetical protein
MMKLNTLLQCGYMDMMALELDEAIRDLGLLSIASLSIPSRPSIPHVYGGLLMGRDLEASFLEKKMVATPILYPSQGIIMFSSSGHVAFNFMFTCPEKCIGPWLG